MNMHDALAIATREASKAGIASNDPLERAAAYLRSRSARQVLLELVARIIQLETRVAELEDVKLGNAIQVRPDGALELEDDDAQHSH